MQVITPVPELARAWGTAEAENPRTPSLRRSPFVGWRSIVGMYLFVVLVLMVAGSTLP